MKANMPSLPPKQSLTPAKRPYWWRLKAREIRMLAYLLVVVVFAAWEFVPRPWHPAIILDSPHHTVYSTASQQQTEETVHTLALLYAAYSNRLGSLTELKRDHPRLKVKLFKDREEFRR